MLIVVRYALMDVLDHPIYTAFKEVYIHGLLMIITHTFRLDHTQLF
jgi:hypothetical protein